MGPTPFSDAILLLGGGAAVWVGAEGMVRGAVKLAAYLGIPSLIIGLTVVAFGTSAPELVVSVFAAAQGHGQVALGNVLGSNVLNIALVLGLSVVIAPIRVSLDVLKRDIPFVVIITVGVICMAWIGNQLGRIDATLLLLLLAGHTWMNYRLAQKEQARVTAQPDWEKPDFKSLHLVFLVGGMIVLAAGAHGMVVGAVGLATSIGISERVVGTTIVAFGTSVPELAASVVAAKNGEGNLALGNVLGSNIYNILLILGTTAMISPVTSQISVASYDFLFFLGVALILLPMAWIGQRLNRTDGLILLLAYALFNGLLFA